MSNDMQREFSDREQLVAYLRAQFPAATNRDDNISATVGGRQAAEQSLQNVYIDLKHFSRYWKVAEKHLFS